MPNESVTHPWCTARGCTSAPFFDLFCVPHFALLPERLMQFMETDNGSREEALLAARGVCALHDKLPILDDEMRAMAVLL